MKIILFLSLLIWGVPGFGKVKVQKPKSLHATAFAIIVDAVTLEKTGGAVEAYRDALEADGLSTYIVSGDWMSPDEVKAEIIKLYKRKPVLEGVVFIGDIPVALIRNAQHMTTAFKMNEDTFPFPESSVPSDRFYDDLHLTFELLGQDTVNTSHFYYRLREDSPQRLNPTFYSGRIKYPEVKGGDKYEAIAKYLMKAVREKKKINPLDCFVSFTGSGYNSECLLAWMDERLALTENFPLAWKSSQTAKFLNFRMEDYMKYRLFDELQRDEIDVMLFHEHGAPGRQYICDGPAPSGLEACMEYIRSSIYSFVKEEIEKKKGNPEEIMAYFIKAYALEPDFFKDFSMEKIAEQSALERLKTGIVLEDLKKLKTNPRFVMFDACYNGSFHEAGNIAGYYIFNDGNTVVTQGNSRNVLQDRWTIEMIGLLSQGVRVGQWNRLIATLEGHIIGDPTFHFAPVTPNVLGVDLVTRWQDQKMWDEYLGSSYADVQSLALRMLVELDTDKTMSSRLLDVFQTSSFNCVRMEALKLLSRYANEDFVEAIHLGLYDAYELIRRNAAIFAGKCGDPRLAEAVVDVFLNQPESQRVNYALSDAVVLLPGEVVAKEVAKQLKPVQMMDGVLNWQESGIYFMKEENIGEVLRQLKKDSIDNACTVAMLQDVRSPREKQISSIRFVRNHPRHENIGAYLAIIENEHQAEKVRVNMAEALGWFNYSYRKQEIRQGLENMLKRCQLPEKVKLEVKQTINRLK